MKRDNGVVTNFPSRIIFAMKRYNITHQDSPLMTTLTIDPQRLKTVRKARKLGRPKLAKLVSLTERQLTKLETAKTATLPEPAAVRLAAALQIPT